MTSMTCPSCGTSQSIPIEKFPQKSVNVNCPKCKHQFSFDKHLEATGKYVEHSSGESDTFHEPEAVCKMNSPKLDDQRDEALVSPPEIQHVPMWVKGIVAVGVILFAIQMPGFKASLFDATVKKRAIKADEAGHYSDATRLYEELRSRYPSDKELIKKLAFTHYHAGEYLLALKTFDLLVGEKMPKSEVEEINTTISDIESKLKP